MNQKTLFDVISPIMVGPSSSHTAGAIRLGLMARNIYSKPIHKVTFKLYNSFAHTGKGHGTQKALVAGLLGMLPDDPKIPESLEEAEKQGIKISFGKSSLKDGHPNSVELILEGIEKVTYYSLKN